MCFHNLAGLVTTTPQTGVRRCRQCSADPRPRTSCCILVVDSSQPIVLDYIRDIKFFMPAFALLCFLWEGAKTNPRGNVAPPRPQPTTRGPQRVHGGDCPGSAVSPHCGAVRSYTIPPRLARTPPAVDGVGGAPQSPQDQPSPELVSFLESCHPGLLDLDICKQIIYAGDIYCAALMGGRQSRPQRSGGPPPTPAHHQGPPARP